MTATDLVLVITLIYYLRFIKKSKWVISLYVGYKAVEGIGLILMGHRDEIPDFWSIQIANTLMYIGFVAQFVSIISYNGRLNVRFLTIASLLSVVCATAFFFSVPFGESIRVITSSVTFIILYGFTAIYLFSMKQAPKMRVFVSLAYIIFSLGYAYRIYGIIHIGEVYDFRALYAFDKILLGLATFTIIMSSLGFFLMLREHDESLIEEKNKELASINKGKDKLFSIIAHDLKSPMQHLPMMIENGLKQLQNQNNTEAIATLQTALHLSRQTSELVENTLNWSVTQLNMNTFNPEKVDVNVIIKRITAYSNSYAQTKKIELTENLCAHSPVFTDANMLEIALRNLINNAIKFTRSNGQVYIETMQSNGNLSIQITDTGVGIEPDRLQNLFGIETATTTYGTANEKGTGIGLVVVQDFIKKSKGTLQIKSAPNKGSTFCLSLPSVKN